METGKSSVRHTFNSHSHCGDYLACGRAFLRIARGLLGRDCDTCSHAINARCDSVTFGRTHCGHRAGCFGRSAPGKLLHRKAFGLRSRCIRTGTFVRRVSYGEERVPLRQHHARHHRAHPRSHAAWVVALHRFFEVSVGIVVALVLAAAWPEHQGKPAKESVE